MRTYLSKIFDLELFDKSDIWTPSTLIKLKVKKTNHIIFNWKIHNKIESFWSYSREQISDHDRIGDAWIKRESHTCPAQVTNFIRTSFVKAIFFPFSLFLSSPSSPPPSLSLSVCVFFSISLTVHPSIGLFDRDVILKAFHRLGGDLRVEVRHCHRLRVSTPSRCKRC